MIQLICIIFEIFVIVFLLLYVRNLKLKIKLFTDYINRIVCDDTIFDGSLLTVALFYGISEEELKKILEEKRNESKKS